LTKNMGPLRIVYVLTSLGVGGAEKLALALGERMATRGHSVTLLVLKPPISEQWLTALDRTHLDLRRSPVSYLRAFGQARRLVAAFRPDIVHGHSFHGNMMARLLGLAPSRPVVVSTIHNVYEGGWPRMLAYRLTDSLSHRTVAVSGAAAERFERLGAVSRERCRVIANGTDVEEFAPHPERRSDLRAALFGLGTAGESTFLWLAVGRVAPAKDYPNLLRAFAQVRAAGADTELCVAGEFTASSLAHLLSLARELSLEDCVHWLGLRRDIPALLDAADGFILSSAWEGMPLAVAEAMAMEKSVVATDVGGVRELVGGAGLVVPSRAPDALAAAMLDVIRRSREERCALGRAARTRIAKQFSIDANADRWEALYREIVAR
jgi:glycosyltransferase involved in cell wall biosynthesis